MEFLETRWAWNSRKRRGEQSQLSLQCQGQAQLVKIRQGNRRRHSRPLRRLRHGLRRYSFQADLPERRRGEAEGDDEELPD